MVRLYPQVKNKGPGRVGNVTVDISWPYEVESGYKKGKHLLYLMTEPEILGNRVSRAAGGVGQWGE